jgi:UDP-N-acetylmuramoyl-tripeptide--D-alanyl-D-alanine ligase
MSMMRLSEAATALQATLRGDDIGFDAVTTDSRTIKQGDLFVALRGDRFDGHAFIAQAAAQGAVAAIVDRAEFSGQASGFPLLVVEDTRLALGKLAAYWRNKFSIPVVAVTGSNGKTTVKEMTAAILRAASDESGVLATRGNLNNDIGLPLTLLGLRKHHRYAVVEMGMNHPGEISYLTKLAAPDVALVNNAQAAHLEGMKNVEAVARAKGEIFSGLKESGVAVINADDAFASLWRELVGGHRVVDFGIEHEVAVTCRYKLSPLGSELTLQTPQGECDVHLQVPGMHNVRNALAATAAAIALDVPLTAIRTGLESFSGVKGRLQKKQGLHGAILIDDTYNANPDSVRAAIAVLASMPGKKILVLGDMGELGSEGERLHAEIGEQAKRAGIHHLFTLGELSRHAVQHFGPEGRRFEYIEDLLHDVENLMAPQVTVLVKGSRFMQMERVVKSFELRVAGCES